MNKLNILLRHNFVSSTDENYLSPEKAPRSQSESIETDQLTTIMMNLSYYGYALNEPALQDLKQATLEETTKWWAQIEPELKSITGDDLNIGDFVVYKNFPQEVLEMSQAEYWYNQILIYWGHPNLVKKQEVKPREKMEEQPKLKVLQLVNSKTLTNILNSYLCSSTRWKPSELEDVIYLLKDEGLPADVSKCSFKENLVQLATVIMSPGIHCKLSATDVLRLAAGMSDGDISLRTNFKFKSLNRKTRRFFLASLNNSSNLMEDISRRPEMWKRLLKALHPGDYAVEFPKVWEANDKLFKNQTETFNSKIENLLVAKDAKVLKLLSSRPGEFRRRLVQCISLFNDQAVDAFCQPEVLNKLTNFQLVCLRRFIESVNSRMSRVFPPRGNWNKLQLGRPSRIDPKSASTLLLRLGQALGARVPKIKVLDPLLGRVKLSSNDGEVATYTRGTTFPIPDNINFIRSASFWQVDPSKTVWFDNGWNFFGQDWKDVGCLDWRRPNFQNGSAIFAGDPVSSQEVDGRAAQLIDLNLPQMRAAGVRYAVWSILCYSNITFKNATKVFAALQWGETATKGNLFEPSRCQFSFPLTSDQLTKYVCYLDLVKNEMVFMDANLSGQTNSAGMNGTLLQTQMPAVVEYLNSIPSIHDLYRESVDSEHGNGYLVYSDKDVELGEVKRPVKAFVFKPENQNNNFEVININAVASSIGSM